MDLRPKILIAAGVTEFFLGALVTATTGSVGPLLGCLQLGTCTVLGGVFLDPGTVDCIRARFGIDNGPQDQPKSLSGGPT